MKKPVVNFKNADGNIFSLTSLCGVALKRANLHDKAQELYSRIPKCKSYDEALTLLSDYCHIIWI